MSLKQKRLSYTIEFKLKCVEYAKKNGNRAAERLFGPTERQVRCWRKQEVELLKRDKRKRNLRGMPARWPFIEQMVKDWVIEHKKNGLNVNPKMVLFAARRVAFLYGVTDFLGSFSWCQRFLKRNGFDRHCSQSVDQNLSSGSSSMEPSKFVVDGRDERNAIQNNENVVETNKVTQDSLYDSNSESEVTLDDSNYESEVILSDSNSECEDDDEVVVLEIQKLKQ